MCNPKRINKGAPLIRARDCLDGVEDETTEDAVAEEELVAVAPMAEDVWLPSFDDVRVGASLRLPQQQEDEDRAKNCNV